MVQHVVSTQPSDLKTRIAKPRPLDEKEGPAAVAKQSVHLKLYRGFFTTRTFRSLSMRLLHFVVVRRRTAQLVENIVVVTT